jgi:cytidylate kinase
MDAVILDSTGMPITEVIERVLAVLPVSLQPR